MICVSPKPTESTVEPSTDVAVLLASVADHLFDTGEHFRRIERDREAEYCLFVGIEIAVRGQHLLITGKLGSYAIQPKKLLNHLRAGLLISKAAWRHLSRIWQPNEKSPKMVDLLAVARALRSTPSLATDDPGVPRAKEEARRIYRGCDQPMPLIRSALRRTG